jgi:leader peptidase (prepilin peptidase)/N-methyltransferase
MDITALYYLQNHTALYISGLGILGLFIGSFLNVVICRLPRMLEREWRAQCLETLQLPTEKETAYNLCLPRSHCPHCHQTIKAIHNIPVLSYLFLRGRCAHCQTHISIRYPLIEIISAAITIFLALHYDLTGGLTWKIVSALIFSWSLLCLVVIDLDHQILPDNISLPLLWLGLFLNLFGVWTDSHSAIIGAIAGYLSLWTIAWIFHRVTGKIGMGHGDFKLLAVLGAWFGWQVLPLIILLSSLVGAIVGIGLILFKNHHRNMPIPFGPYLALAGWIAMLWGSPILHWYLNMLPI